MCCCLPPAPPFSQIKTNGQRAKERESSNWALESRKGTIIGFILLLATTKGGDWRGREGRLLSSWFLVPRMPLTNNPLPPPSLLLLPRIVSFGTRRRRGVEVALWPRRLQRNYCGCLNLHALAAAPDSHGGRGHAVAMHFSYSTSKQET